MAKKIIRVPHLDNNPTPDPDNYTVDEILINIPTVIDPEKLIGLIKAFNDYTDNLPYPLLSVRIEPLPDGTITDYLLFGRVWQEEPEAQFGTIRAHPGGIELHRHFIRDWVNVYFSNLLKVKFGRGGIQPDPADRLPPGAHHKPEDVDAFHELQKGVDPEAVLEKWLVWSAHRELQYPMDQWKVIRRWHKKGKIGGK